MLTKTKTKTEHPQTMGCALNNKSTTTEHRIRTDSSLSYRGGGGGLKWIYWRQIFALDSAGVKTQNCLCYVYTMSPVATAITFQVTVDETFFKQTVKTLTGRKVLQRLTRVALFAYVPQKVR